MKGKSAGIKLYCVQLLKLNRWYLCTENGRKNREKRNKKDNIYYVKQRGQSTHVQLVLVHIRLADHNSAGPHTVASGGARGDCSSCHSCRRDPFTDDRCGEDLNLLDTLGWRGSAGCIQVWVLAGRQRILRVSLFLTQRFARHVLETLVLFLLIWDFSKLFSSGFKVWCTCFFFCITAIRIVLYAQV